MAKRNDELKSKLFSDMKNLASDDSLDESSFLASLASLVESDEYNELADELVEEDFISNNTYSNDMTEIKRNPSSIDYTDSSEIADDVSAMLDEEELEDSLELAEDVSELLDEETPTELFDDEETSSDLEDEIDTLKSKVDEAAASLEDDSIEDALASDISGILDEDEPLAEVKKVVDDSVKKQSKEDDDTDIEAPFEPDVDVDDIAVLEAKEEVFEQEEAKAKAAALAKEEEEQEAATELEKKTAANKKKNIVNIIIRVACILVFLYCVGRIGLYYYQGYKWKQSNKRLANIVGDISKDVVIKPQEVVEIHFPDELIYTSNAGNFNTEVSDEWAKKYQSLVEMNPDCVGWLQIPDTNINYPVMYTPDTPDKYLYKNFEGDYYYRGLPFMADGTLLNVSQNYILYGHHMADGTAFNHICKYLNHDFLKEHKYAYLNTAYSEGVYEVMAVVITKIFNVDDECFKYYKYTGNLTEDEFNTYVYYMKKMSSYDTGVDAVYGDQLISLSTCYRVYDPEGRLVVVFKRVQ